MHDPQSVSDFRSDTVTRPSPAMRRAMAEAEVGDDVFGEDPTVRRLEQQAARITGKERALFVPSGTMANQISFLVHCRPGDEALMEDRTHSFLYEGAGAARFAGVQIRSFPAADGIPAVETVRSLLRPDDVHHPRSRLLVVENTHNMAGGRIVPIKRLMDLRHLCLETGLKLHMDGARIFNAAVASGVPVAAMSACADSVAFCLSKGLGAPVGSMLCGDETFYREALRARKALGGGMRQIGVIAAAGIIALTEGPLLLQDDHKRAKRLAKAIAAMPGLHLDAEKVETNIVIVETPGHDPFALVEALKTRRILALVVGPRRIRFVLHRDVGDRDVFRLIGALSEFTRMRPEALPRVPPEQARSEVPSDQDRPATAAMPEVREVPAARAPAAPAPVPSAKARVEEEPAEDEAAEEPEDVPVAGIAEEREPAVSVRVRSRKPAAKAKVRTKAAPKTTPRKKGKARLR